MTDQSAGPGGQSHAYLAALQDIVRALTGIYTPLANLFANLPWTAQQGGTGRTSLTTHAVLLGEGTAPVAFAAPSGAGKLLIDQGAAADPSFNAMSGDATITNVGALTIANNAITTSKITDANVTYAKIQNISATQRVLGRNTAGAGVTEEVTFSQFLDWVGSAANGDILYRTGGVWARLPIGTNTNVLTVSSSLPAWAAPAGGSTLTPSVDIRTASATITIPTNATKLKVTLVGGGGGGGGAAASGASTAIGGPGGPAGVCVKYLSGLTPGNTLALTIGGAGAAGTAGNNAGGAGGDTTLASGSQTITTLTAAKGSGGGGAAAAAIGTVGASGAGTNGDLNITGGLGYAQFALGPSTGCPPVPLNIALSFAAATGLGLGTQVVTSIDAGSGNAAGTAGRGYGGPGSGGIDSGTSTAKAGGAGAAGAAIFEWYIS